MAKNSKINRDLIPKLKIKKEKFEIWNAYFRHAKANLYRAFFKSSISATLMLSFLHTSKMIQDSAEVSSSFFLLIIVLLIGTTLYDFFVFTFRYYRINYYVGFDQLYQKLNMVTAEGNQLLYRAASVRLNEESSLVNKFLNQNIKIPALQSLEYVRFLCHRILVYIVKRGDYYFTISNLNYWSQAPMVSYKRQELLKTNKTSVEYGGAHIYRIIIIEKELLHSPESLKEKGLKDKQVELRMLIKDIHDAGLDEEGNDSLSTHFYLFDKETEEKDKFLKLVFQNPMALILTKDLKDLMLVTTSNMDKINDAAEMKDIPYLRLRFHSLPKTKIGIADNHNGYLYHKVLIRVKERIEDTPMPDSADEDGDIFYSWSDYVSNFEKIFSILEAYQRNRNAGEGRKLLSAQDIYTHFYATEKEHKA